MEIETKKEENWRKFLLGDVTEAERAAMENRFLADEEDFARGEIVESELIEDYLRGELTEAERKSFETAFLRTAVRRERVERMKILLDEADAGRRARVLPPEKISFREKLAALLTNHAWQTAFAASIFILVAASAWWFLINRDASQPETAQTESPAAPTNAPVSPQPQATTAAAAPDNSLAVKNADANKSKPAVKPSPTAAPEKPPTTKPPETALAVFILKPGGIRGGAAANRLRVAPQTNAVNLRLNLESAGYVNYRARLTTVDGTVVYTSPPLKSNKKSILFQLPIRNLRRGDYIVELSGVNAAGQAESVDDYAFTLEK